mmetsp:Transcript_90874/g.189983  ORF Transcript_90874/g.189983 Transcript_90874/m.189983 type:complete len:362 (-) Transcript_90874:315-1400(-)
MSLSLGVSETPFTSCRQLSSIFWAVDLAAHSSASCDIWGRIPAANCCRCCCCCSSNISLAMSIFSSCTSSATLFRWAGWPPTESHRPLQTAVSSASRNLGCITARAISSGHSSAVSTVAFNSSLARQAATPSRDWRIRRRLPLPFPPVVSEVTFVRCSRNSWPWADLPKSSLRRRTTAMSLPSTSAAPFVAASRYIVERGTIEDRPWVLSNRTPASRSKANRAATGVGGFRRSCLPGTDATMFAIAVANATGSPPCFSFASFHCGASSVPRATAPGRPARVPRAVAELLMPCAASGYLLSTYCAIFDADSEEVAVACSGTCILKVSSKALKIWAVLWPAAMLWELLTGEPAGASGAASKEA